MTRYFTFLYNYTNVYELLTLNDSSLDDSDISQGFDENKKYKFVLTNLLHISQQVWWLKAIPGEIYPLVNILTTGSKKYSFSQSKHRLEYACLFELSIYMILFKRSKSTNQSYISFYESNDNIKLWMTDMKSFDPIRQKSAISAYSRKQDQAAQRSYYSILKILSTIMSFSSYKYDIKDWRITTNTYRKIRFAK